VLEDAVDHMGLGNECDDAHLVSAPGTLERVDLEDAPQRVCRPPFACTTPRASRVRAAGVSV
jgi:hypothetical protein